MFDVPEPTIGRIVTYRTAAGVDCPAIVVATRHDPAYVELAVFYPAQVSADFMPPAGIPHESLGIKTVDRFPCGSWRWPERVG